jgi:hypothetical protein
MASLSAVPARRENRRLEAALKGCAERNDEWAFEGEPCDDSQVLFQYPSIMVPQMQRQLLAELVKHCDAKSLYDPFLGSGTTMAEAMLLGLDVVGQDINPLAVLVSRVKAGPFFTQAFSDSVDRVLAGAIAGKYLPHGISWPNAEKWFEVQVMRELAALTRSIRGEQRLCTRRFLWVCLAETVRLTSNSRTSTVKLHIRPRSEIRAGRPSPLAVFGRIADRNLQRLSEHRQALRERGFLRRAHYTGLVQVFLQDIADGPARAPGVAGAQVLLSSPPYGDNQTTVPYGQHAYLPLRWIDPEDIDARFESDFLASTHSIDRMSLGGSRIDAIPGSQSAQGRSPTLKATLAGYRRRGLPRDRQVRVAAFWRDLDDALDHILAGIAPGALMGWTVGNRSVGGRPVPMDRILTELLEARGAETIAEIPRRIPNGRKRMAERNNMTRTMTSEKVLVLRAPSSRAEHRIAA